VNKKAREIATPACGRLAMTEKSKNGKRIFQNVSGIARNQGIALAK
jgi:hypothetical protein